MKRVLETALFLISCILITTAAAPVFAQDANGVSLTVSTNPTSVTTAPGETQTATASATINWPAPASNETIESTSVNYTWTNPTTYGTVSPTTGPSTTDTYAVNEPPSTTPYTETIACSASYSMTYTVTYTVWDPTTQTLTPESQTNTVTGTVTGSANILVTLSVNYAIAVRRTGTANWGSTTIIGANDGDASTADVQITVTDANGNPVPGVQVPNPSLSSNSTGIFMNAAVNAGGTSNSSGVVSGTYSASDEVTDITLTLPGASATVSQHWDDSGAVPVPAEDSFDYGQTIDISYTISYTDSNGTTVPLDGHEIFFATTSISGWEWNGANYVPSNLSTEAQVDADTNAFNAVTYTCLGTGSGNYPGSLTVSDSGYYAPDEFTFDAEDAGTFPAQQ